MIYICYSIGQIARDDDLKNQIGKDIFFDLVDHDKVQSFRIQKQTPFIQFKVAEFFFSVDDSFYLTLTIKYCRRWWPRN